MVYAIVVMMLATAWTAPAQPAPANVPARQEQQPTPPPGSAGKPPPGAAGQTPGAAGPPIPGVPPTPPGVGAPQPGAPVSITLQGALQRATTYGLQFLTAGVNASIAREARMQAKAAMLPSLNLFNQYIYTEGNGTPSGVFVANDGVHIYNEQAVVHADLFSVALRAEYRRAIAAEEVARAQQDIAARGLVATVVQNYYAFAIAQRRVTQRATQSGRSDPISQHHGEAGARRRGGARRRDQGSVAATAARA